MKDKIIEEANSLGIDKIGFSKTTRFNNLSELLSYRKVNNYICEFEEEDLNKRIDVSYLLPNCKTIITAIFPYAKGYKIPKAKNMGNISVSSYGMDYHKVLHEKLELLALGLQKYYKFNYKICVDNTPAIDRAICKNSGLGYIGNNSMLINDEYGSFVFLGSILTDLDIPVEDVNNAEDKCGNCNICINKCPNNAILDNKIINTKRCVSYLTQTKSYIPIEYRKAMGNQIYGCDICQINCPKNNKVLNKATKENYSNLLIDLKELFELSNRDFNVKYGNLAGSWRGKNIWKRNAIIACANMKYDYFYDLIKNELYSQSDMFKTYAAWALLELNREKSKDIIFNRIKHENEFISNEYKKLLEEI